MARANSMELVGGQRHVGCQRDKAHYEKCREMRTMLQPRAAFREERGNGAGNQQRNAAPNARAAEFVERHKGEHNKQPNGPHYGVACLIENAHRIPPRVIGGFGWSAVLLRVAMRLACSQQRGFCGNVQFAGGVAAESCERESRRAASWHG